MAKPIIKWAGGKAKIWEEFKELYDIAKPARYVDLFCGSLTLPLLSKPRKALFNDINSALINMYTIVKNEPEDLLLELKILNDQKYNCRDEFETLRNRYNKYRKRDDLDNEEKIKYAAIFIYLNKRSFNGLYRENSSGQYNVPYRQYKCGIFLEKEIRNLSEYLNKNKVTFESKSFAEFNPDLFKSGDLVYLDPPYYPSNGSKFTSYWKEPFHVKEQKKLLEFCKELDKRGVKFIMSNSPCKEIVEMYEEFHQKTFRIGRQMRSAKKGETKSDKEEPDEILVWNFSKIEF